MHEEVIVFFKEVRGVPWEAGGVLEKVLCVFWEALIDGWIDFIRQQK